FAATGSGAACITGAALLSTAGCFVQPSCWTQLAIFCLASGDQPSSGALVGLSAGLPHRKTAKPRWLQHQYKVRPGNESLARIGFPSRFLLFGDDCELPFAPQ